MLNWLVAASKLHILLSEPTVYSLYCASIKYISLIWTACLASKSVIKNGRSMRVFAHEVNCWPVLFCIFLYVWRASDVQITLIFVSIRPPLVLSTDNASFNAKNIRAGSPDLFMSMIQTEKKRSETIIRLTNPSLRKKTPFSSVTSTWIYFSSSILFVNGSSIIFVQFSFFWMTWSVWNLTRQTI